MANVKLGSNCDLMRYNNEVFTISSTAVSSVGSLNGLTIQASSSDLQYLVAGNNLFKYSSAANNYTSMTTVAVHPDYWIQTLANKIVIWGSNSTASGAKFNVNQDVYVMVDNSSITTIHHQALTSFNNVGTSIPVHVSPLLSKIHF